MIDTTKPGTPEELVHYGVKGMKWGVRKKRDGGGGGKQARREARAKKFDTKSAGLKNQINQLEANKQRQSAFGRSVTNRKIADLQKKKAQADKDAEAKRQGKLSRRQKQVIVGAAVVGTLVAAGVTYKLVNSGEARQMINKGKGKITGKQFEFKKDPSLATPDLPPGILRTIADGVNPGYHQNKIGSATNCRRCTFAYELRRRGFDVTATRTPTGSGQHAIGLFNALDTESKDFSMRKAAKAIKLGVDDPAIQRISRLAKNVSSENPILTPGSKAIFRDLAKQPSGSRGELGVRWVDGGGHSMAYEIVKGAVHILDTQTGRVFSSPEEFAQSLPLVGKAGFTRLDNVPLDAQFLQRWVKNA